MKILFIDDDQELLAAFTELFEEQHIQVVTTIDGTTGIEKAKSDIFDLILIDQILPDMRGNDIIKVLKNEDKTRNIPLVMFSNFDEAKLIHEAMQLGAVDYILKYQIEPPDLIEKIKKIIVAKETN